MIRTTYHLQRSCRICGATRLLPVLDLGKTPLANAFLTKRALKITERKYPLAILFCPRCSLVQLRHVVDPSVIFTDYHYRTGASKPLVEHFKTMAHDVARDYRLTKKDLVVEIGSNDGSLLKAFAQNAQVLGVDPAGNVAREATRSGVETISAFFTEKVARRIVLTHGRAKVIVANNVFAHIDDLDDVLKGVGELLTDDGVFIFEAHWVGNLIGKGGYDQIYHEHLSYFSLHAAKYLAGRFGLLVTDAALVPMHGESLRISLRKKGPQKAGVKRVLEKEKRLMLTKYAAYKNFARKVAVSKAQLRAFLATCKKKHRAVVGYGAPGKGNTLLNYVGLRAKDIAYLTDTTPEKQGTYAPGSHIPILSPAVLAKKRPDYILLLAWNYAPQILAKEKTLRKKGTKFIIPVPEVRVV